MKLGRALPGEHLHAAFRVDLGGLQQVVHTDIGVPEDGVTELVSNHEVELRLREVVDGAATERHQGVHAPAGHERIDARLFVDIELHVVLDLGALA